MPETAQQQKIVFRCRILSVCLWLSFLSLNILAIKDGELKWVAISSCLTIYLFFRSVYPKLEIQPERLTYVSFFGTISLDFAEIEEASFESSTGNPDCFFYLQPKYGQKFSINLNAFPLQAAAVLLTALERNDIPIEVSDHPGVYWTVRRIREAQSRLEKKLA